MEQTNTTVLTEVKVKKDVYLDLRVKILLKTASMPKYAHIGDAGLDLTATSKSFDKEGNVSPLDLSLPTNLPSKYACCVERIEPYPLLFNTKNLIGRLSRRTVSSS